MQRKNDSFVMPCHGMNICPNVVETVYAYPSGPGILSGLDFVPDYLDFK
jgi:hypothetical protein